MSPTENQIKYMVDRFLAWRLPTNFRPDHGITYINPYPDTNPYPNLPGPMGTNLFDAKQAETMVRHITEGMPDADGDETISPYEWLAQEFERLAVLRKMWTPFEVAEIIRRHDLNRPAA